MQNDRKVCIRFEVHILCPWISPEIPSPCEVQGTDTISTPYVVRALVYEVFV